MSTQHECAACGCEVLEPRILWVVTVMDPNSSEKGPFSTFLVDMQVGSTPEAAIQAAKDDCNADDARAIAAGEMEYGGEWNTEDPDLYWEGHEMKSVIRV